MKTFTLHVPDAVGEEFKKKCVEQDTTPHALLSKVVHKFVEMPRNPQQRKLPPKLAKLNQQRAIEQRRRALAAETKEQNGAYWRRAHLCSECGSDQCRMYCKQDESKKNENHMLDEY